MFAVILSVPRIAALRPAAAPAIIKSLLQKRGLESQILDINLDFHDNFRKEHSDETFWALDDYFFNDRVLTESQIIEYNQFIDCWIDKIKLLNPKWLMISVFTWQAQKFTRDFLIKWKEQSDIPVIVGGQGQSRDENGSFSSRPEFSHELKNKGLIAHWVRGEIETTIDGIINNNFNDVAGIDTDFFAERSNVNDHEFMNFDDFDIRRYHSGYEHGVLPVETSRGCVRNCMFCDIPTYHNGYRYKTGQRLFDEIIYYHEKYKVKDFFFHDALCNGSVKDFRIFNKKLVEYYRQNNLPDRYLKYSSHYIVRSQQMMKERDFELMGQAGAECMVIGVESGSDKVRADMRKGFTSADLDYNMKMFSKYGINAYFLMIVGFPTETREDFEQTLTMLKRYQPYVADGTIIGVNLGTTLTIEEGTPIWTEYNKFNIIGTTNSRPQGPDWKCLDNPGLTYKERIQRRIEAQEVAVNLGYTFWKGDDQLKLLMDNYKNRLNKLAGVIH